MTKEQHLDFIDNEIDKTFKTLDENNVSLSGARIRFFFAIGKDVATTLDLLHGKMQVFTSQRSGLGYAIYYDDDIKDDRIHCLVDYVPNI